MVSDNALGIISVRASGRMIRLSIQLRCNRNARITERIDLIANFDPIGVNARKSIVIS